MKEKIYDLLKKYEKDSMDMRYEFIHREDYAELINEIIKLIKP